MRSALLVAVSALVVFAFACGGDDDDEGTADPGGSPQADSSTTRSPSGSGSSDSNGDDDDGGSSSDDADSDSDTDGNGNEGSGEADQEGGHEDPAATPTFDIATPVTTGDFTPAEGEYCDTVSPTSPPNSLFGLLELDGDQVPAGTEVTIAFDGVPGPSETTIADGGYRVDFGSTKAAECANKEGAEISLVVDGTEYKTGRQVGSAAAIRFDIVE